MSRPGNVGETTTESSRTSRRRHFWMYALTLAIAACGLLLVAAGHNAPEAWPQVGPLRLNLQDNLVMAGRLLLAMGLTLAIGLERERRQKPAGMRTVAMVGIGACGFALIGTAMKVDDPDSVSRMIQGVITGIGFLGAGTILKEQFHIEGLTTAATLWTVAAIGLSAGVGLYDLTILLTVGAFIVLKLLGGLERAFLQSKSHLRQPEQQSSSPSDNRP